MPWKEVSAMVQRREFVELAMQEGANRRELCRRFGISRKTRYKWLRRFLEGCELVERSRRPHSPRSPHVAAQVRRLHPGVSRQHALIEHAGGAYYLVDMGSTNGVEFEGERIARKEISHGDRFRIGDFELEFLFT